MTDREIFTKYKEELLESIPVVSGMDIDILDITELKIQLSAPLNSNINYEGTAFGGSINTLCILSCYLLTHHLLRSQSLEFNSLVIQNSSIKYLKPVENDFSAIALVTPAQKDRFLNGFKRKGVSRLEVASSISMGNETLVSFQGRFIAKK